ncbi:MAG TPA: anthranilate synthase component I family protein [Firmicutes bacterium]|nr:anthranilate synthase component I family protein [Bacillota bacterium]
MFVITDVVVIFDHLRHTVTLVAPDLDEILDGVSDMDAGPIMNGDGTGFASAGRTAAPPDALTTAGSLSHSTRRRSRIKREELLEKIAARLGGPNSPGGRRGSPQERGHDQGEIATLDKDEFCDRVRKAKEFIRAGDIFQVVLSRRVSRPLTCSPFDIYRALRSLNPSPYLYYLDFGRIQLIGSSPETLVRLENGVIESCPIAGTRPRGQDAAQDAALARELLADEKERAEHVMLVDLARNDVGRVAVPGTVCVPTFMEVEYYSDVMHLVSSVRGRLKEGRDAFDVLAACFPAGTVSGAPKVRAMEIIDELEPVRRGPYAGAVGYFGFNGNMDTAITIRTLTVADGLVHVQAGAGIVADSEPEREFLECQHKARAMFRALEWACAKEECDLVASPR